MSSLPKDILPLLSRCAHGCLVLTPNHRTSRQLLDWYGQHYIAKHQQAVCPTPSILPVDIWIRQKIEELNLSGSDLLPAYTLLESSQERLLWQKIINESDSGEQLLNQSSTARAVQEAWSLVHLWRIDERTLADLLVPGANKARDDLGAYLEWSGNFKKYCQTHKLTTLVQLLESLLPLIRDGAIDLPEKVIVSGFHQPPPLYQELLKTLEERADSFESHSITPAKPEVVKVGLESATTEISSAANWAKSIADNDPEADIGIVIPNLHGKRDEVQRIFSRAFDTSETLSLKKASGYTYSVSAAGAASKHPLIQSALRMLGINNAITPTLEICSLLRSPFLLAADTEETGRANLEVFLRKRNFPHLSNADLRFYANLEDSAFHAPLLARGLLDFDQARMAVTKKENSLLQWGKLFETQLDTLGWPGERKLNEDECRAMLSWSEILATYYQMNMLFQKVSLEEALGLLTRLSENTALKHSDRNVRIQVLTPTEADGLSFTHCWMTGLSERQWPAPAILSPFIPYGLQKSFGIPEADINRHTEAARTFLKNLLGCTRQHMVFSYPLLDGEIPLKATAMLLDLEGETRAADACEDNFPLHPLASRQLQDQSIEQLEDKSHIALLPTEKRGGGYLLLADQADCPFRNFASQRLNARPLEKLVPGLSARDAGILVHLVLEMFWQAMQSHSALLNISDADLKRLVDDVIDKAVTQTASRHKATMTHAFCKLEKARLNDLLLQWLEEEKRRGSFRVLENECEVHWQQSGLQLDLRIDRIDLTESGQLVLVDYKTSRSTAVSWEDERPINPQLMLYNLAMEQSTSHSEPVTAVLYAQVNIENTQYKGLSAEPGIYPGTSVEELNGKWNGLSEEATWSALKTQWQESLTAVAEEFLQGYAAITPSRNSSCTYCSFKPVCRIDEVLQDEVFQQGGIDIEVPEA